MSKVKCIGIIAEDDSDYESSKVLIKRITSNEKLSFKKAIGNGCGKIRRKALAYTIDLNNRGCDTVILLHDLDRRNLDELKKELNEKLTESPVKNKLVCIPVEEIESWFLSDPAAIKTALNLKRQPNVKGNPEMINSPKEILSDIVFHCSDKNIYYLNTKHNEIIASVVSIDLMKNKCKSFNCFFSFIIKQKY